jgi:C4-type Zn-finger protein
MGRVNTMQCPKCNGTDIDPSDRSVGIFAAVCDGCGYSADDFEFLPKKEQERQRKLEKEIYSKG